MQLDAFTSPSGASAPSQAASTSHMPPPLTSSPPGPPSSAAATHVFGVTPTRHRSGRKRRREGEKQQTGTGEEKPTMMLCRLPSRNEGPHIVNAGVLESSGSILGLMGSEKNNPTVPLPARAARFAPLIESAPQPSRFTTLYRSFMRQISMTPLTNSTTGTSDSAATPSDLEAGTSGSNASTSGASRDWSNSGMERSWTRGSWKKMEGSNGSARPSISASDDGGFAKREKRRRKGRTGSSSSTEEAPRGPLSYVVVENSFESFVPDDEPGDEKHDESGPEESRPSIDGAEVLSGYTSYLNSDSSSRFRMRRRWTLARGYDWLHNHVCLPWGYFADSSFSDKKVERVFQKEVWYANKHSALMASLFLVLQWALTIGLQMGRMSVFMNYSYIGICGFWTLPLPFLVLFNGPRRFPWTYEIFVAGACWCWGWVLLVDMYTCGFYALVNKCGGRNFLHLLTVLFANASFAVMSLGQNRLIHVILATMWLIAGSVMLATQPLFPRSFYRNLVVFELFHLFLAAMAYFQERSVRQLFTLRAQLKDQYRAIQSAQAQERRAEDSKKRFVSYIFHEVRVPLNTARLALANMDSEGAFSNIAQDQKELVIGLDGSLRMMEKVLNDVLSFSRMESGNLIQARQPFNLHKAVHYVALSHRVTAEMNGVDFQLQLDPRIDEIGGTVIGDEMRFKQVCSNLVSNAFKFTPSGSVKVVTKLLFPALPNVEGKVDTVGSYPQETRPTSLCTPANTVMEGHSGMPDMLPVPEPAYSKGLSDSAISSPNTSSAAEGNCKRVSIDEKARISFDFAEPDRPVVDTTKTPSCIPEEVPSPPTPRVPNSPSRTPTPRSLPRKALIRVEVHDTGVGLSLSDVRDNRLFSPYVQTEIGRRQGGKGSGLGLALIMQIVKLSRGRLGVDSELGKGSVFWFEIPYALPLKKTQPQPPLWMQAEELRRLSGTTSSPRSSIAISVAHPTRSRLSSERERENSDASATSGTSDVSDESGLGEAVKTRGRSLLVQPPMTKATTTPEFSSPPFSSTPLSDPHEPDQSFPMSSYVPLPSSDMDGNIVVDLTDSPTKTEGRAVALSTNEMSGRPFSADQVTRPSQLGPSSSLPPCATQGTNPPSGTPTPPTALRPSHPAPILTRHPSDQSSDKHRSGTPSFPTPLSVLVVDDDALTRKLMTRLLKRMGHPVLQAENGKIALAMVMQRVESNPIDIIFLDNQMPHMTGVEVARALRTKGIDVYIVGCTGNALREDQDEYLNAGADYIITKPLSPDAILHRLEEVSRRKERKARAENRIENPHPDPDK